MTTLLQALKDEDESGLAFSQPETNKRHNMRGMGKTQVLLAKDDIEEALSYGYPVLRIWATLYKQDKTTLKYDTFRAHVNKLIKDEIAVSATPINTRTHNSASTKKASKKTKPKKTQSTSAKQVKKKTQKNTFSYNPIPNPDELY